MRYLYFDCIAGASGDMLLGAFMDGHVPLEYLQNELAKLSLSNYQLDLQDTFRHSIHAKKLTVVHQEDHHHRHLNNIIDMIDASKLSDIVKAGSIAAFQRLGEQEAHAHQMPIEKVHFHEVGAVDSIVDIVGVHICVDFLRPDKILASRLPLTRGRVKAAHGILPVPAPATAGLLKGYPLYALDMEGELVTPTGALLISQLSEGLLPTTETFTIDAIGYGAGSKDFQEIPNFLRIWSGQIEQNYTHDAVLQIETNIDDLNPEIYPHLFAKLFEDGAIDVMLIPGLMKKGRPGLHLTVLCDPVKFPEIKHRIFLETSTIGLRYQLVQRAHLPRKSKKIDSPWGKIRVKAIEFDGKARLLPEYEECRRIAEEKQQSLRDVYSEIEAFLRGK